MTMLLIRCPNTNKLVGTSVHRDKEAVDFLPDQAPVHCTGCGEMHGWGKRDVVPQTWASGSQPTWAW